MRAATPLDRTDILYYPDDMVCIITPLTSSIYFPPLSRITTPPAAASPLPALCTFMSQRRLAPVRMLHLATTVEPERWPILQFCANLAYRRLHFRRELCKNCKSVNQAAVPPINGESGFLLSTQHFLLFTTPLAVNRSRESTAALVNPPAADGSRPRAGRCASLAYGRCRQTAINRHFPVSSPHCLALAQALPSASRVRR